MNNEELFIWTKIEEAFIREYGIEDGSRVCDYAEKVYYTRGSMTLAVRVANEWARRMRLGV